MLKRIILSAAIIISALPATSETTETALLTNLAPVWQPYDGAEIKFEVLRKGKPFGSHNLYFDREPTGLLKVTSDVDLKVKVGPFTAFSYELDAVETWREGQLIALQGKTNDDGDKTSVDARLSGGALNVSGSAFSGEVPSGIIPSSHWNMDQIRSDAMLSTEDGSILEMNIVPKGRETLKIDGTAIEANRYLLDSDIDIDLWYDDFGRWLKLTFEARGQTIEYRLTKLY